MHTLDDATLIQQFISGEVTLAANQNLRIEPAFDSVQLLSKRCGLVASMKRTGNRQSVLIRRQTHHTALLHQILLARHFIPTPGVDDQLGFKQYRTDEIPAGYEVAHDVARTLWKEWWRNARQSSINSIQIELLIFARDTWYPIRNIVCSQGVLFITTLVSEVSFQGNEQLTWLRQLPAPRSVKEQTVSPMLARSLQPISKPIAAQPSSLNSARQTAASTPSHLSSRRDQLESEGARPDLRQVLRFRQGKLYVTTALGEIVVEGSHLKFRLDNETTINPQKPLELNDYRDRESQAVSL